MNGSAELPDGHSSPAPSKVDVKLLLLGLAVSPFAWIAQLLITYGLSSNACSAIQGRGGFAFAWSGSTEALVLLLINLGFLGLAALGGALSYWNWRQIRQEASHGDHLAMSAGQGRTRFIAACGMMAATAFGIAILFNTVEPLLIPLCWAT